LTIKIYWDIKRIAKTHKPSKGTKEASLMLDSWGLLELLRIFFSHGDSRDFDPLHGREIRITFVEGRHLQSPLGSASSRVPL
jgi:hypothetical protein